MLASGFHLLPKHFNCCLNVLFVAWTFQLLLGYCRYSICRWFANWYWNPFVELSSNQHCWSHCTVHTHPHHKHHDHHDHCDHCDHHDHLEDVGDPRLGEGGWEGELPVKLTVATVKYHPIVPGEHGGGFDHYLHDVDFKTEVVVLVILPLSM